MVRTEILEAIQAATPEDKVLLLSLLTYDELPIAVDLLDNDVPAWGNVTGLIDGVFPIPIVYNIPANSETPIIVDFLNSTIKIGSASPGYIGVDLTNYKSNPDVKFKLVIDSENTAPIGNDGWINNELWTDGTYTSLAILTIQPDTDTGLSGGLTLDNINIIIKP